MNFSLISAAPTAAAAAAVFPKQQLLLFKVLKKKKVCCGRGVGGVVNCKAFLFDTEDPVLKQALKEPVAFVGGMFAGIMRLDLNEDPLKDWLSRTVQASDAISDHSKSKSTPQQQQQEEEEEVAQQIQIE